jgi:membrane-bound lytic murein transglycosylase D
MVLRKNSALLFLLVFLLLNSGNLYAALKGQDEVYQSRLAALKTGLEINYHPSAKPFIEQYLANPEQIKLLVARSKFYFPLIEKSLKQKGLPTDLKYLAATASLLDPSAVNANGASGIWMMMFQVSKMYKLKVNTYVDDRRDPVKSSQVAAQHFKDLFSIYKSWPLAIAAYGCSPVQLNKSIHSAGNSLYFWDIYKVMPSYCRDLYPKVIATVYILNYYKEHGVKIVEPIQFPVCDTVWVPKWLSFQQVSNSLDMPIELIRELNPQFRKDIIPYAQEPYFIRIPNDKAAKFSLLKDSVYRPINQTEFQPISIEKDPETVETSVEKGEKPVEKKEKIKKIFYTVKRGEVLSDIADWFDVSSADLSKWNKIKKNKIKAGQKLAIFVPGSKTGYYNRINKMTAAQKKKLKRKD